jgi:tetratricopeptide (TPR) repeat protein
MMFNDLGRVYHDLGRYGEAREHYERGLDLTIASEGEHHPHTAAVHTNLGTLLVEMDELELALPHLERAVTISEAELGPQDPDFATNLGNLALGLRHAGQYLRAWELCSRALEIDIAHYGPDHLSVAYRYNLLGQILKDLARFGIGHEPQETLDAWALQAHEVFELALEIFVKTHRRPHPEIAMVLKNHGNLFKQQGNCPSAREYLERSLAVAGQVYPPDHPFTRETEENLATLDC